MKLIKSLPFILTPTLLLAACGSTTPTKPPVTVTAPTISATPATLNVTVGQQQTASLAVRNTTGVTVSAAPAGLSATISGSSLIVSNTAAAQGSYPLTLTATGPGGTAQTTVTVTVPAVSVPVAGDFSIKLDPSELTLTAGQSADVSALVTPSGDFKGDVTYSVSGAPAGLTATVRGATLSFTNVSAATGTSTVTVTATSGTLVHTALLRVTTQAAVQLPPGTPDFVLSATPSTLSLATGAQGTVTLNTSAVNNFNAPLTYSVSGAAAGLSATISGTTLTVINTSAAPGSYPLTLSASGGGVTHATTVVVTVPGAPTNPTPDFTLNLTPPTLTLAQGQSGTSSASVSPTNGFTGSVSYSVSGAPAGLQAAFNGATLTVTNASAAAGSYALTVTATSGSLTHTTTLTVQVPGINTPPTGDVTIALQLTPLALPENGSVNFQVYYANQNYDPDLSRPYTGALDLPNSSTLAAQGLIVTQESGKIIIKDNGNTQPGNYFIEVKPSGSSDSKMLARTLSFAISNSVSVVNSSAVALDSTGVSHAVYTFKGNNIGFIEPEIKNLPYQGLNGTIRLDNKAIQNGPRNGVTTLTLGFGFAAFDTDPLPINMTVHFIDGSRATVPVTLQYQVSPHSPVKRFPAAIHAPSAQEQAAIAQLNAIRASGTCGGKQYGTFPPVVTDVNLDNGNREYAAYNLSIGYYDYNRDPLRLYALLNGYRDADYTMNGLQLETTFNMVNGDDGAAFARYLDCGAVMQDFSRNRVSIAYYPLSGTTGGYWSYVIESISTEPNM